MQFRPIKTISSILNLPREIILTGRTGENIFICIITMFLAVGIGFFLSSGKTTAIVLIFLPIVAIIAFKNPLILFIIYLTVALSIFRNPGALPGIALGGGDRGNIFLQDILLSLLLISCFIWSTKDKQRSWKSTTSIFILILLGWVFLSALYGLIIYKYNFFTTLNAMKLYLGYLIFFVPLTMVNSRQNLEKLIKVLFYCSIIFSFIYVLLSLAGFDILSKLPILGVERLFPISAWSASGNFRLYMPATALAIMTIIVASSSYLHDRSSTKWWIYGLVILMNSLAILLNFTRGDWITTAFSIIIIWIISPGWHKPRLISFGIIFAICFGCVIQLLPMIPTFANMPIISVITTTFVSLFKSGVNDINAQGRLLELTAALAKWRESPIIGLGIAATWKYNGLYSLIGNHMNLGMLLPRLGLIGAGLYLAVFLRFLARVRMAIGLASKDMLLRGMAIGFGLSGIQVVVLGFLSSGGLFDFRSLLFFLDVGFVEAICRLIERENTK